MTKENEKFIPEAPLFRDPVFDGAADPTVIWNKTTQEWWMFYTNRRASNINHGVSYCYGSDIGIASSADGGKTWVYRGIAQNLQFENGRNTFWAPEVIYADGLYHMYCSYIQGVYSKWGGDAHIVHYTSEDLWDWCFEGVLKLCSDKVIDACVYEVDPGIYKMWYKDERHNSVICAAISTDLYKWALLGIEIADRPQEGPNVFEFKGQKWMITDPWKGLGVYRSDDFIHWQQKEDILFAPGIRQDDTSRADHADVVVCGEHAYMFYFVHPEVSNEMFEDINAVWEYRHRRTSIQVAEIIVDGDMITCDRNREFYLELMPNEDK